MKKLQLNQLETINGGGLKFTTITGLLCGGAFLLACSVVLAPLAAAPAVGCAATLAAKEYWESQGIVVE